MVIQADIAVEKAPRRSKERLRKCQRTVRKQLWKWTHRSCSVRSESAAEDLQLNIGFDSNSTALQVEVPARAGFEVFGDVLHAFSEGAALAPKGKLPVELRTVGYGFDGAMASGKTAE